ncbi:PEP-CTERM sorting domain-containing protein [Colwellia sp. E150_009]
MSSKILNAVLFCLLSLCLMGKANATLIVGTIYEDQAGVEWEYVGSFDLAAGPHWDGATPYNGLEAAEFIFGSPIAYQYALSSFLSVDIETNVHGFGVNHMAWYDSYNLTTGVHEASESAVANVSGASTYDADGDISAYINDRAWSGENISHVFKSVTTSVPEPSTLAIFAIALVGLASRRIKR